MEDIQVLHGTVVKESMQLPINLLVERDSNHNIYKTIEFQRDGNPTNTCIAPPTNL
jgi:ribosomal protein S17